MHWEVLGSIWKIGRYPIKVSEVIACVEISNKASSSKSDELRNITYIGCRAKNITFKKWEIDNFKIIIVTLILNFGRKSKIRNGQM